MQASSYFTMVLPSAPQQIIQEFSDVNVCNFSSCRFPGCTSDFDLSILELRNRKSEIFEGNSARTLSWPYKEQVMDYHRRGKQDLDRVNNSNEADMQPGKDSNVDLMAILEKATSKLCFSEGLAKGEEDYEVQVTAIYEMLNSKKGMKYSILKDVILDQLLTVISSSKEEGVTRASISILTKIVSLNKSAIEDIKKGLKLCDLATALKRNVHEAATLLYLINPPPNEIKTLEILPALVEIVCSSTCYNGKPASKLLSPLVASLMIIEVLVTAFDSDTNNMHLASIVSPRVLTSLLDVARENNLEECISVANILIKCMQYDGQCRKYVLQSTPLPPFKRLLQSKEKRAKFTALKLFHEILFMPRSSAISLLKRILKEGSDDIMQLLMQCVQQLQPDHQLTAANLLLQLDTVQEHSSGKSMFMEEAMRIILRSVASEENSSLQKLSTFILANIGGTFSWTGEPYTVALLVKKAGLISMHHRNVIRNFDWSDQSLQDAGIDSWSSKISKRIISIGKPVFQALEKGLRSKNKRVSRNSLTAIAWIGCEMAKYPNGLRNSACEILLNGIEQFLHPGMDLEVRLLACLGIFNYTSGKGMQKLIHFSEGVRESLRRFSGVTWMAEELHRVADFYLPNSSRISCIHTQILEAKQSNSGAVTALIYYRGLLFSGYSDGSIKVWDIKRHSTTLVWDIKDHRKAVTCFSLFEPGESLLSGSADKTIRVWRMMHQKLECIEVIAMKEPVEKIETYGQTTFAITQGHGLKVFDSSRVIKDICKTKKVKCMTSVQGKLYIGCLDSSIQELSISNNREREIKPPLKSWRMQDKSINSIVVHKNWVYNASSIVEGSKLKEWRTQYKPEMSMAAEKGRSVVAIGVVEDFIYLNCSSSTSTLQMWLRGKQQNVGRISAGSKITSLLTANDIVLCGTEKGLIKGWIPL